MPFIEWPHEDQSAWVAARLPAGLMDEGGLAAHWRPATVKSVEAAYGRWLTFLAVRGRLDRCDAPADRINRDDLRAYIEDLTSQVAPVTASGRIRDLLEALRVMVPRGDFSFLRAARRNLKRRARPQRNKSQRLVGIASVFQLGFEITQSAERDEFRSQLTRAAQYRDGLILMLLASRPLRRTNFVLMTLGRHLKKTIDSYRLDYVADEMKGNRDYTTVLDPALSPLLDRYLTHYRPILAHGADTDRVWISSFGRPLAGETLYGIVVRRTKRAFGKALWPHLIRDCAITSLGAEKPELVWMGMALLHHNDPKTTEKHYDHAVVDQALQHYQNSITLQRGTLKRQRRRSTATQSQAR
jgi:integrase